jgi:hypothetical protein
MRAKPVTKISDKERYFTTLAASRNQGSGAGFSLWRGSRGSANPQQRLCPCQVRSELLFCARPQDARFSSRRFVRFPSTTQPVAISLNAGTRAQDRRHTLCRRTD